MPTGKESVNPVRQFRLSGERILSFVYDDFEDLELWYPIYRLREEGAEVVLAGEKAGQSYTGKYGVPAVSDVSFETALAAMSDAIGSYTALLVPGGWAPDKLRRFPAVLSLVRLMDERKLAIGQICHAGWVLISARILKGRKVTSTPGIRDDMVNAGADWVDEPVVVDGNLVSSRRPPDLPDYMRVFISVVERGRL